MPGIACKRPTSSKAQYTSHFVQTTVADPLSTDRVTTLTLGTEANIGIKAETVLDLLIQTAPQSLLVPQIVSEATKKEADCNSALWVRGCVDTSANSNKKPQSVLVAPRTPKRKPSPSKWRIRNRNAQ